MAILPDYTSGLISLAKGSVTVTGTGTMFEAAAFKAGDVLLIQNLIAVIANVDSNTKLTLMVPWTGTSLVNAPYRLRRTPDGTTVSGRTTTLIEMLGNGVLTSIAELPVQAGSLLVGNAAGGYSHINIDEVGIDDPHGNLAQLASLAKVNNQFVIMGADGSITLKPISELVDAIDNNRLAITALQNDKFNKPTGTLGQFLRGNGSLQSVVGTVTQAAGGAIIQQGRNANGEFVRYADGTQICWGKSEVIHSNSNSNTGRLGGDWAYPAAFSTSNNEVFMNIPIQQAANWTGITGAQSGRGSARAGGAASSATGATLSIFFDSGTVSPTEGRVQNISVMAIGRWY